MMKDRNLSFDLLRAIGLLCIILAHVNPPTLLFQIRTFDVVMMVCISTLCYTEYSKPKPYLIYLQDRFKRLLLPAWEYIILLGIIFGCISLLTGTQTPYPIKRLLIGCVSLSSVGYLWIIRVFLYNAFINPFIIKLRKDDWRVFALVSVLYVAYSVTRDYCMKSSIPYFSTLAEASFLDFWSYGLIAVIAWMLYHLTIKDLFISLVSIVSMLSVVIYIDGSFIPNDFKYPPALQYILWGLTVVCFSFLMTRIFTIKRLPAFIVFLSKNSMWIYFWHLIPVNFIKYYSYLCSKFIVNTWYLKYILIVVFAVTMVYVQNMLIYKTRKIIDNAKFNHKCR